MFSLNLKIEKNAINKKGSKYLWYIVYCGLFINIKKNKIKLNLFSLNMGKTNIIENKDIKKKE